MARKRLNKYGLMKDYELGVWWLVQDQVQSAIGLPFKLEEYKLPPFFCPHSIDLENHVNSEEFLKDIQRIKEYEVYKAFVPLPVDDPLSKIIYVQTNSNMRDIASLITLHSMQSPTRTLVFPISIIKYYMKDVIKLLNSSDIITVVVTGCSMHTLSQLSMLIPLCVGAQGRLVIVGEKIPRFNYVGVVKFTEASQYWTEIILGYSDTDEFKKLGASIIYKHMRGEK